MKRKTVINAYLDGKLLCGNLGKAALDAKMRASDLKRQLTDSHPGREVTFKVE